MHTMIGTISMRLISPLHFRCVTVLCVVVSYYCCYHYRNQQQLKAKDATESVAGVLQCGFALFKTPPCNHLVASTACKQLAMIVHILNDIVNQPANKDGKPMPALPVCCIH